MSTLADPAAVWFPSSSEVMFRPSSVTVIDETPN